MNSFFKLLSVLGFLLVLASTCAYAQKPRQLISKGDKAYFENDNKAALAFYEQALAAQPDNIKANYRAGLIYLELDLPAKAIPLLLKATTLSPRYQYEYTFNLARAYHLNSNFEEAIPHYRAVLAKTRRKEEAEVLQLKKFIHESESGMLLLGKASPATVKNLGAPVNSPQNDHVPLLSADDQVLYFTSRRIPAGQTREANEDIYETRRTGETWSEPKPLGPPVNTPDHDAATCISADGKSLFLYRDTGGGDIYESKKTAGGAWGEPQPLPEPINSGAYEPSFFLVNDIEYSFFSSDREEGYGGLDIYLTIRQPDGTWSEAMNLGPNINSPYDEDAPFISDDGITLYFSSKGHNSMGGFDLFRSSAEGAAWLPAQNLGVPVNTPYDDIFFSATTSGQVGYFSSNRPGGLGATDIYQVTFRSQIATDSLSEEELIAEAPFKEPEAVAESSGMPVAPKMVVVSGTVLGADSKMPLVANLILTAQKDKQPDLRITTDSLSGRYHFTVEKGKPYNLLVQKEGYFFMEEEVRVPVAYTGPEVEKNISLKKIETGTKVVLRNIFFEYNSDVINKSSMAELQRLEQLLRENPGLRIEISGHTDDKGKP
ncbi:MAG TPA: hypothetical protein VK927_04085, partial [Adhaeribacter sp.]|nr:hypothetical protein [Adhaeribacter sp.]